MPIGAYRNLYLPIDSVNLYHKCRYTLSEINSKLAPENGCLEYHRFLQKGHFKGLFSGACLLATVRPNGMFPA